MRRALQIFLALFGAIDIAISLLHVILGPAAIPGAIPVNATMDSEDRFYATLFTGYGAAVLWCVKGVERKSRVVYFLLAVFFFGGVARLVSMIATGAPHPFFVAMTAIELTLPALVAWAQRRVSAQSRATQSARTT